MSDQDEAKAARIKAAADARDPFSVAAADRPRVDLDAFVAARQVAKAGTREIVWPEGLRFAGKLRSAPRKIDAEYIYTALSVMKVAAVPQINHTMFVESASGAVRPVYVRDDAVARLQAAGVGAEVELTGFHVYTYAKGPAIVVDGLAGAG